MRLVPGVLGAEGAADRESFATGLLEPPQYTRPETFAGLSVPAVLRSGDHARIDRWRRVQALWRTWQARPDLLPTAPLSADDRTILERFGHGETAEDIAPSAEPADGGPARPGAPRHPRARAATDASEP
jgi:tRNA (guanine37-N1)-methyltransferase